MKPIEDKNYYELLELSCNAGWGEIQMAYELARRTYKEDSMSSYSLFTAEERGAILAKVEEAYRVLSDSKKKQKYDQALSVESPALFSPPSDTTPPPVDDPVLGEVTGEIIKTLREKRGVSLEEISETTRINIDYLSAIEKGNFDFLPAEVYIRSYLRQVAKIIRCGNEIVEGYMQGYQTWSKSKKPMGLPSRSTW